VAGSAKELTGLAGLRHVMYLRLGKRSRSEMTDIPGASYRPLTTGSCVSGLTSAAVAGGREKF